MIGKLANLGYRVYLPIFILLVSAPLLLSMSGHMFYLDLLTRTLIIAMAVASLNLIVGCGGMVSLGHAAYIGIGAYSVAIPSYYDIHSGMVHLLFAVGGSAIFALVSGAVCLRTKGLQFILITLAFSQMLYFAFVSIDEYGADDGIVIAQRSEFGIIDLENAYTLYFLVLAVLLVLLFAIQRLTHSHFGRVVFGSKHNDRRMRSLGFDTYWYRLTCYVISAAICGLAGFFLGNFTNFISPEMMDWTNSADLIFMLVLGGIGTLLGPIIGATVFLLLQEFLSGITIYWNLIFGVLLIAWVLFNRNDELDAK